MLKYYVQRLTFSSDPLLNLKLEAECTKLDIGTDSHNSKL